MTGNTPTNLLVVDRPMQEDILLWPAIARALARREKGRGFAILHAAGETPERALEAAGLPTRDASGRLVAQTPEARVILRRALIEENRKIAGLLTEEGISAVGFIGTTRQLLARDQAPWLVSLVRDGVVPVVSAVTGTDDDPVELDLPGAVILLAGILRSKVVLLVQKRSGREEERKMAVANGNAMVAEAIGRLEASADVSARVTDVSGLSAGESEWEIIR